MANGHGGLRPGSGRPKGTHTGAMLKSRLSPDQQTRVATAFELANGDYRAFAGDAYALLVWVYRSPDVPIPLRMRAAEAALVYERAKPSRVEVKGDRGSPLQPVQDLMQMLQGAGGGLPTDPTGAETLFQGSSETDEAAQPTVAFAE